MIHAPSTTFTKSTETASSSRRVRLGMPLLLAMGVVLLVAIVAGVSISAAAVPAATPVAAAADMMAVRTAVLDRLDGVAADPMVEAGAGALAPASSVRGLSVGGTSYYYYVEGQRGYDPLSRGEVAPSQVREVLRDARGASTLVIYTIAR